MWQIKDSGGGRVIDPYKILHVNRSAGLDEIQAAYRKLAKRWHPDRNPGNPRAEAKFKDVQTAWEILGDAERRARFDATGDTHENIKQTGRIDAMLSNTLAAILNAHLGRQAGWGFVGRATDRIDLVGKMRESLQGDREKVTAEITRLKNIVDELTSVADRFVTLDDDERNLLRDIIRNQLGQAKAGLATGGEQLELVDEALVQLKRYGYKIDMPGGQSVPTPTSLGVAHLGLIEKKKGDY